MAVVVVRYTTKPELADENQGLVEEVFAALSASEPDGLRYATFRLADGVTFIHIASIETVDGSNPLTQTPAFLAFSSTIAERCDHGPVVSESTVVGSYRFFATD